jgi:histidinol-phosphate aminotransferase
MGIDDLIRENIRNLNPYVSARNEYSGSKGIFLDANENSMGSVIEAGLNRYPDPLQNELKDKLAELKQIKTDQIFIGNGSDEAIDLLIRAFCEPGKEKIMITPPTYGIYAVCAAINAVQVSEVLLNANFDLNVNTMIDSLNEDNIKLIFLCSPNNPTGNCFSREAIINILQEFKGLVVIDEAYLDFSNETSWIFTLNKYERLVVLQTFSKAWGLANMRLGMAFANPQIIQILNRIKYPYNVNGLSQRLALKALSNVHRKEKMVSRIIDQRNFLLNELNSLDMIIKIYPSQANFLLVKFRSAREVYDYLLSNHIIVRDRSNVALCDNCLRITVGSPEENQLLIAKLKEMELKQ